MNVKNTIRSLALPFAMSILAGSLSLTCNSSSALPNDAGIQDSGFPDSGNFDGGSNDAGSGDAGDGGDASEGPGIDGGLDEVTYEKLGYLNVRNWCTTMRAPCMNAVGNGSTDDTAALQQAVNFAHQKGLVTFLPSGTYLLSDTLHLVTDFPDSTNNDRRAHQLVGSLAGPKPILKLADGAPGFNAVGSPKPLIDVLTCISGSCGAGYNQNFNQHVRNLTIDLTGTGHSGAVGVHFRACEGSLLANVNILATGAFAGVLDLPGSGGSVEDLSVEGGRYGLYATGSEPMPVVSGLTLHGQTVNSIYDALAGPLLVVGFDIVKDSAGAGSAVVGGLTLHNSGPAAQEGAANLLLVDGQVSVSTGTDNRLAEHSDRNIYMRNVYTQNVAWAEYDLLASTGAPAPGSAGSWGHIQWMSRAKSYSSPVKIANGVTGIPDLELIVDSGSGAPPLDLVSRHAVGNAIPSFEDPGVVFVTSPPFLAAGDGGQDDWAALQGAIDVAADGGNGAVFLPKGVYRIGHPLILHANTRLFGPSQYQAVIAAQDSWATSNYFGGTAAPLSPMVTTDDDASATTVLAELQILLPRQGTGVRLNGLTWRAGRDSLTRDVITSPESLALRSGYIHNLPMQRAIITGNGGGRWYNRWSGYHQDSINPDSRAVLVQGTHEPLRFYMLQSQYQWSDANNEFQNSSNITVYGLKSENLDHQDTNLLRITDCDNIGLFGHFSNANFEPPDAGAHADFIVVSRSSNVEITHVGRSQNSGGALLGGTDFDYVREMLADGGENGIDGTSFLSCFRRGTYVAP